MESAIDLLIISMWPLLRLRIILIYFNLVTKYKEALKI